MKLEFVKHMEKEANGRLYKRDEYTLGDHYKIVRNVMTYEDGTLWTSFEVFTRDDYMPEICYNEDFYGEYKPEFKIQTCAYGSKDIDEIEKIIAGYQEAVEVVKVLTAEFC